MGAFIPTQKPIPVKVKKKRSSGPPGPGPRTRKRILSRIHWRRGRAKGEKKTKKRKGG